ncbi:MAG: hydroxylamine oxidase [Candidatus Aminicenantes bacterium]|nr:hydroxylamine oxidase [Candidatus Aminicenantes bacterium]
MKKIVCLLFTCSFFWGIITLSETLPNQDDTKNPALSQQTEECLGCHETYSPGIVEDWRSGSHAHITPAQAMTKPLPARKISSTTVKESLLNVTVGCYECHGLNADVHKDNFNHFDNKINVVVSPDDCAVCHAAEREQFASSKKAHALGNLEKNPVYHKLVETITSTKELRKERIEQKDSSYNAKAETCYGCHGTEVTVKGKRLLETDAGAIEIPQLANWPNQGVGRINPDGSRGACTACHLRHSFSIAIARKPDTCSQCHLDPDLPAWNVYRESKHGNIFHSLQGNWNWESIPWTVGKDFKAPTCSACHNSLLVSPEGDVIAERSHDFGARLWVRIFGLIYAHPQPKMGDTYNIKNKDDLPLPTTFTGEEASAFLLDKEAQALRQKTMRKVCSSCHSSDWADGHFAKLRITIEETDKMVLTATEILLEAWDKELADTSNPFDEMIEQKWLLQWLFYANSVRYASAMSGPDYAAFKNGWWNLTKNLQEMRHFIDLHE